MPRCQDCPTRYTPNQKVEDTPNILQSVSATGFAPGAGTGDHQRHSAAFVPHGAIPNPIPFSETQRRRGA